MVERKYTRRAGVRGGWGGGSGGGDSRTQIINGIRVSPTEVNDNFTFICPELNSTQLNSTVKAMSTYGRKVCRSLTDSVLLKIRTAVAPTVRHVNFVKRPSVSVAARALNGVVGFHGFARV